MARQFNREIAVLDQHPQLNEYESMNSNEKKNCHPVDETVVEILVPHLSTTNRMLGKFVI